MVFSFTNVLRRVGLLAGLLAGVVATAQAQAPAWQAVSTAAPTVTGSSATITATATDASGNVYVAGWFTGAMSLGGTMLSSAGSRDVFVAKWVPATQSLAWVQQSSGTGNETLAALAVSGSSIYVGGLFETTAVFGGTTLTSAGSSDAFVAKLTDAGSSAAFAWAYRAGGSDYDQVTALAVQGSAVYAAGAFEGTATFGSAPYSSAGSVDSFLTKLTDAGATATFAWTQALGSVTNDYAKAVAVQGSSVYVSGYFTGAMAFGPTTLGSFGTAGMYVAKLTDVGSSSSFGWAQWARGTSFTVAYGLAVQGSQVYLGGRFQGTATFGSTTLPSANTGSTNYTGFVARLTDAGATASFGWAYAIGGTSSDYVNAVAVRGSSVFVAGGLSGTTSLGSTTITISGYPTDVFVAKLTDAGPSASFVWAQSGGSTSSDEALALALTNTAVYVGGWVYGAALFGSQPVGATNQGQTGFFTSLADATGLATTAPTTALANVAVFPTPTPRGTLATVQLPAGLAAGPATLTVLDNLGRVVRTRTAALVAGTATIPLDVAGLAPGVYALRVAAGEQLGTARLVVE